jgi:large subunit ribosomal protein L31e
MAEDKEIERIFVIPLRKAKHAPTSRAAPNALRTVRQYLIKHMKVEEDNIWIDESVNTALWARGKFMIPSKIRVRAVKFEDGVVEASLPELGGKTSRRELLKEEKEKKTPILRRPEEEEGEEDVDGTEDYEIAPTGDGEVKIKKKKPKKEEKDDEDKEEKAKKPVKKPQPKEEPKKTEKPETTKEEKKTPAKKAPAKKPTKKPTAKKTTSTKKTTTKKPSTKKKEDKDTTK